MEILGIVSVLICTVVVSALKHGGISRYREFCPCVLQTTDVNLQKALSNVFLSVSIVINHKHPNLKRLIATCASNRILVESDYNDVARCTPQVLEMIELVSEVKGWAIEEDWDDGLGESGWGAVRRLFENWKRFKKGSHPIPTGSKRSRKQKLMESSSESES